MLIAKVSLANITVASTKVQRSRQFFGVGSDDFAHNLLNLRMRCVVSRRRARTYWLNRGSGWRTQYYTITTGNVRKPHSDFRIQRFKQQYYLSFKMLNFCCLIFKRTYAC